MNRFFLAKTPFVMCAAVCALLCLPQTAAAAPAPEIQTNVVPEDNEYVLIVHGYDWGPAADKIILNAGKMVIADVVRPEEFTVEILMNITSKGKSYGFVKGKRVVTAAYLCDENGNKLSMKGTYVAIELKVTPEDTLCNPFFNIPVITSFNQAYGLRIANDVLNISIVQRTGIESPLAGQFNTGKSVTKGETDSEGIQKEADIVLPYASWEPPAHADKTPLVIWLHGITGGGTDAYVPLFDTKTVTLITPQIQNYFAQGACVLVPQCPTGWLETTSKDILGNRLWEPVDIEGSVNRVASPVDNFFHNLFTFSDDTKKTKEEKQPSAAVSYYTVALKQLIDNYIASRPYIDKNRIYLGGCSAGGYMVVNMLIQYPDFFAAAFPTCEAYLDSKITDRQIQSLSKMPLWFTYAKNDETIKPDTHCVPTIKRIHDSGAENLHVSVYDNVHDTSGKYFMKPIDEDEYNDDDEKVSVPADSTEEKVPFQYCGHYSWIYVLNDECEDNGVKLFDWLSKQSR